MSALIVITTLVLIGVAVAHGDWGDILPLVILAGLILFVWQAVMDAGQAVVKAFPREQYNLTQNRYEITESDDPTKPNENIPAIIEIGRHYGRKP